MKEIYIAETASTNSALAAVADDGTDLLLYTHRQTSGRGQRGNSWEAEPGKNLTFSLLIHPTDIPAAGQFAISEAVALAVAETIAELIPEHTVAVKWPNDIYVDDRKISGILIENALAGSRIERSIVGIGLNVNQTSFVSPAPNPVSLSQLTGTMFPLEPLMRAIARGVEFNVATASADRAELHRRYCQNLWRREGRWQWRDNRTARIFTAEIADVAPEGNLILRDSADGSLKTFAFKELSPILTPGPSPLILPC